MAFDLSRAFQKLSGTRLTGGAITWVTTTVRIIAFCIASHHERERMETMLVEYDRLGGFDPRGIPKSQTMSRPGLNA